MFGLDRLIRSVAGNGQKCSGCCKEKGFTEFHIVGVYSFAKIGVINSFTTFAYAKTEDDETICFVFPYPGMYADGFFVREGDQTRR
jgi:hypothetical protein